MIATLPMPKYNIVNKENARLIENEIVIKIKSQALYKNRLLMLDIIANNEWKRPIYFTGGAFGDEDYIWMKEYLQLDGMCYKLIPIKTPMDESNPYEMGRIESEKMLDIIENWSWGKRDKKEIYYDVESRKNSISYRKITCWGNFLGYRTDLSKFLDLGCCGHLYYSIHSTFALYMFLRS